MIDHVTEAFDENENLINLEDADGNVKIDEDTEIDGATLDSDLGLDLNNVLFMEPGEVIDMDTGNVYDLETGEIIRTIEPDTLQII